MREKYEKFLHFFQFLNETMLDSRSTFLMAFQMTNFQSHWLSFRRFKTVKMTANEIGNSSFETPSKTSSANLASSHSEIEKNAKTFRIFLALQICFVR